MFTGSTGIGVQDWVAGVVQAAAIFLPSATIGITSALDALPLFEVFGSLFEDVQGFGPLTMRYVGLAVLFLVALVTNIAAYSVVKRADDLAGRSIGSRIASKESSLTEDSSEGDGSP